MKAVRVPVKSFNDELRRLNPTFLIMDIEGAEYELMGGITEFGSVRKISVEVHEWALGREKVEGLKAKLTRAGFALDREISTEKEWLLTRTK
jgi:hypothetical protein